MFTTYAQELRLFNTRPKRIWVRLIVLGALLLPFAVADDWLRLLAVGYVAAIGAIGLNLVTGYAGQVTLGHAFFLGVGAYTAAVVSGDPDGRTLGFGITSIPVWLLAAGTVAGLCGLLVAPLAVRLRGLYLAIVTLGLVFIGEHIFKEWGYVTGGPGVGRAAAVPEIFGYELNRDGPYLSAMQQMYLLMLVLLVIFAVLARNLMRSKVGRAFAAVRDRDIAAEIMGVGLTKHKALAFVVSSFYAGCAGRVALHGERVLRSRLVQPAAVRAVHRHGAHRGCRHHLRLHHGRAVHHVAAAVHAGAAVIHPGGQQLADRVPQRVPGRVFALRSVDHRVPDLRATWPVRHLDSHPQLLEGMALHLLIGRTT